MASLAFVFFYVMFNLRSPFLAVCGLYRRRGSSPCARCTLLLTV